MRRRLRLGANKGKPRLWLEGQWLGLFGFHRGTTFVAILDPDRQRIQLRRIALDAATRVDVARRRHVSGKGDRPVIDITGEQLRPFAGKDLQLEAREGLITITGA